MYATEEYVASLRIQKASNREHEHEHERVRVNANARRMKWKHE
jgi:hypothetical protein